MKKLFFTMMLAIVSSVWVMSEAQCLVPSTEQEGPFVEELTGLLCLDAYPCPYDENCPTCLTMVLRAKEKKYYLTGSVMESIDAPTDRQYVKVVVSGITGSTELGNNEYYNWLKVETLRYSEEPVTTNIQTHGYVDDESGTRLEGIRVIVHTADRTVSDTVYTHEDGEFVSTIKGIVYPVDSMYVTVSDVSGRFKEQTKSTTYTYECGVEFNPETDTGFNSKELLFVLQEKTPSSERWCMPNNRASEGKTIRVGGTLKEVSAPCISDSEEEPCLPCLTIALKSRLKTYYVVSDDAEVLAILDTVSEGLPAIAEGIAFTNGSYSYLQVSKIKPVIVSEFQQRLIGNWQVYKTTITGSYQDENREYSDGETMDFQDTWWNIDATTIDMQGPAVDNWGERLTYTLREQADGTWQIIVPYTYYIDYQQGTNEIILYTIHQLTTDRMEWESTSVNSDGTSTTFHEYLWRLPHTEEEPQYFPKGMQWTLDRWQEEKGIVSHSISSCIVQGDTVINDKTYRNIVDGDFIAPIRQEGKKIYVHLNDKDFLLYDFGLEVGDSIPAYGGYGYDPNNELPEIEVDRVVRIDSVTLLDGRKAKVFFYEYRSPDIEYVGDEEFGVLNPIFGEQACTCLDRGQSMCCSLNGKPIYGACGNLHENDVDTIPMFIKDGPGTSTVEPVDPNQITVVLNGDQLTIHEYLGTEISYVLTKAPSGNNMPARNRKMASDTFSESVSIQLTESGLYTLTLTSPDWDYSIVGTFEYDALQGVEIVETSVPAAQKILRDGQLFIRKGDKTYTVQGIEIK